MGLFYVPEPKAFYYYFLFLGNFMQCDPSRRRAVLGSVYYSRNYSMCGGYRHIVARPADMQWHCVRYSEPYSDLLLSDLDELEGRTTTGITEGEMLTGKLALATLDLRRMDNIREQKLKFI